MKTMTLEEENLALRLEVGRLSRLCDLLREECSVGFRHGLVRRSPIQPAAQQQPTRSLLDL
ncbi:hypothetical protein [Aureimonas glaciei]|uniref:Uncharacterized protein n=1 Tax=Aureimonas glaciei TaxID=1776957 RepID=A0A916YB52_9HYPH|nr:hypothetical protein [Aureimonas glaciei]GGD38314.1 hypothetical protein GCM10011335_46330 [Aureimonas glaciei]